MDKYKKETVKEVRRACYQFARLYFNFCKTLKDSLGEEGAFEIAQKAIFSLSLDRSDRIRACAQAQGLELNVDNFMKVNDLPFIGWQGWAPDMGGVKCPYAEVWLEYYQENPWFQRFAAMYCDVIDTTNIESFSGCISHRLTKNLVWGDDECQREYFPSEQVKEGVLTYGKRNN